MSLAAQRLGLAPGSFPFSSHFADIAGARLHNVDEGSGPVIVMLAHDWGGPIGLAAGFAAPGRLTRFVLGNTWAWPVNGDWHFEWFARLMGGAVGRFGAE